MTNRPNRDASRIPNEQIRQNRDASRIRSNDDLIAENAKKLVSLEKQILIQQ